ncbi:Peptide methionine sulfoxide reductase MrsB [Trema orientale]|uniref:Peptide methionine sulfoxide reductase MrsB n=1 Tax=Trema orientale TaxID=63057 RepID=A0A2P5ETE7_TREOI|nr:Peptide methionine sulfoxide reductase MrsB [Trema orientale]
MAIGVEDNNALVLDRNRQLHLSPSLAQVSYSCGSCGFQLNLNSSNRNTSFVYSKYGKLIKKGKISFFCIDESRFVQVEKLQWIPFFTSKSSWGLFQRRTKLLCRKCGNHIGHAYKESTSTLPQTNSKPYSVSWDGMFDCKIYDIKIRALQPSSSSADDELK